MSDRSGWKPAIPEPLWVGPFMLIARCDCGKRFLGRKRYRDHWDRVHEFDHILDGWPSSEGPTR